jgi:heat shock protein HslJ
MKRLGLVAVGLSLSLSATYLGQMVNKSSGQAIAAETTNHASTEMPTKIASMTKLDQTSWRLVSWTDAGEPKTPISGTEITLQFLGDTASGSAGCNRYNASYSASDHEISFGTIAATRKACPGGIDHQETAYLMALELAESYAIAPSGNLEIVINSKSGNKETLTFAPPVRSRLF